MPTTMRKNKPLKLSTITINLGCGCSRPKLSSIFNPKPKTKIPPYHKHSNFSLSSSTSSTTWDKTGISSSPFSPYLDNNNTNTMTPSSSSSSHGPGRRVRPKSVAVEKESNDPYLDFRQSMLQMIVENEIYSRDDLKELLNCFLQLNSPSLHGVIIRVFTEIWNGFFFSTRPEFTSPRVYARPKFYEV